MSAFNSLWGKFRKSKKYREEFVGAQLKQGIPFQIRSIMKARAMTQETLATRSGLTQGVVSRAADLDYGNLTLNTIVRIAAGFDMAFVGKFVSFKELGIWFTTLSEEDAKSIPTFEEEDSKLFNHVTATTPRQIPAYDTVSRLIGDSNYNRKQPGDRKSVV